MNCKCATFDENEERCCCNVSGEVPDTENSFLQEYVIVYKAGIYRETYIGATSKEDAKKRFKKEVGDYFISSCELSDD